MSFLVIFSKEHLTQLKKVAQSVQNNINHQTYAGIEKVDQTFSLKHCRQISCGCDTVYKSHLVRSFYYMPVMERSFSTYPYVIRSA